jgi:hypothetical protein
MEIALCLARKAYQLRSKKALHAEVSHEALTSVLTGLAAFPRVRPSAESFAKQEPSLHWLEISNLGGAIS